jgi:FAD:protein FMN transferase
VCRRVGAPDLLRRFSSQPYGVFIVRDDPAGVISSGEQAFFEYERRFPLFGSHLRLLIGSPARSDLPSPEANSIQIEFFLRLLHKKLTRFDTGSELSAMNADPRPHLLVSPTLMTAIDAALWAARRSDGLVDPTLVSELETVGYGRSRADVPSAPIPDALALAPERKPAHPWPASRWREVAVNPETGVVARPPGVRIDTGGTGKGLAADLAADRLTGYSTFVVDAGGDLRLGGEQPVERQVRIDHPLEDGFAHEFTLDRGAVATSGIKTRLWRTGDGFAHHLLDPSTGEPAWTGVIQATSLGATAVEAETLAKMAFLAGPDGAAGVLAQHGGLIVTDDGSVERFGPLANRAAERPRAMIAA